ncbi:unnamed protein product [Symbiodinium sp. KB8]|nr:unnamed protein product [Symbiodinium sp. KB8]
MDYVWSWLGLAFQAAIYKDVEVPPDFPDDLASIMLGRAMLPAPGQYSVLGSPAGLRTRRLRKVTLSGFLNRSCNGDYVQRPGLELMDRPTYWSADCSRVLFCNGSRTWLLASSCTWLYKKLGLGCMDGNRFLAATACLPCADIPCNGWWYERAGLSVFARSKSAGYESIDVHVKIFSLASTIPGASYLSRKPLQHLYLWEHYVPILCRLLDKLPADDGSLSISLERLEATIFPANWDEAFREACLRALHKAQKMKMDARQPAAAAPRQHQRPFGESQDKERSLHAVNKISSSEQDHDRNQAGVSARNTEVVVKCGREKADVRVLDMSLLSTMPGADVLMKCAALYKGESRVVQICRVLQDHPSDDGSLSACLPSSKHEMDSCFWSTCLAFQQLREDIRQRAMKLEEQERCHVRVEEERSRRAAEELIAEEKQEQERERKRTAVTTAKSKKPRGTTSGRVRAQAQPSKAPHSDLQDSEEDAQAEATKDFQWCALQDISDPVSKLRHNFPMFDDDVLSRHLLEAACDLEQAVLSLSKLEAEPAEPIAVQEPADIPVSVMPRRSGAPKRLVANVIARTDHAHLPLYCFIAVVAKAQDSQKYRAGQVVRPIPEDRFRLLGDEKGHFWKKITRVPAVGDIVEVCFFEEDTYDYLATAHGKYPHQNEDLLCTTLTLHSRCDLSKNDTRLNPISALASAALQSMAVEDVESKWPWKRALGKFDSVQPGKKIWYVHPKKHLPSVVVVRIQRCETVQFKYRSAASNRISVDFSAGGRFLTDIAVTAAGFDASPLDLNRQFSEKSQEMEHLFVLGLARAERQGPGGYNRLEECSEPLRRQLDLEALEEYCQILLIGVLPCLKEVGTSTLEDRRLLYAAVSHALTEDPAALRKQGLRKVPLPMGESCSVVALKAATGVRNPKL